MINTTNRPSHCMFKGIKKINKHIRILPFGTVLYWMISSFGDLQLITSTSQTPLCYNSQWLHKRKGELLANCWQIFWSLKFKVEGIFINYINWNMRNTKLSFLSKSHFIIIICFSFYSSFKYTLSTYYV